MKYPKGIERLADIMGAKKQDKRQGWETKTWIKPLWISGPTGTGKTSAVYKAFGYEHVYPKNAANKWWDGFVPGKHKCILIDDYPEHPQKDSGLEFNDLLRYLQPFPIMPEKKGGLAPIGTERWVITSNYKPGHVFYKHSNIAALDRRIKEIETKTVAENNQEMDEQEMKAQEQWLLYEITDTAPSAANSPAGTEEDIPATKIMRSEEDE